MDDRKRAYEITVYETLGRRQEVTSSSLTLSLKKRDALRVLGALQAVLPPSHKVDLFDDRGYRVSMRARP